MKKINTIKENREFSEILNKTKPIRSKHFNIYLCENTDITYKIGLICSKKNGKAYERNKIKRKIKTILENIEINNELKFIIMIKKTAMEEKYENLKSELEIIINKLNKGKI